MVNKIRGRNKWDCDTGYKRYWNEMGSLWNMIHENILPSSGTEWDVRKT